MKKILLSLVALLMIGAANVMAAGATVGNTDNSSTWWTAFSDYYKVPEGYQAHVTFKNYSSKSNNWNNWLLVAHTADTERGGEGYVEYFVIRNDNAVWGTNSDVNNLSSSFNWNTFKDDMDGSSVDMYITNKSGKIYMTATITTTGGTVYPYSFNSTATGANDFSFFLTVELSHIEDLNVEITEKPAAKYTVTCSEATNGTVTSDAATEGVEEGSSVVLTTTPNDGYELESLTVKDASNNDVTVTNKKFTMPASNVTVTATFKEKVPVTAIGNEDNTTAWWTAFSDYYKVKSGQSAHVTFKNYTSKEGNPFNWIIVAHTTGTERAGSGYSEYFVLRADNYGWGNYYDDSTLKSAFNWDTFKDDMDGSSVDMYVYNIDGKIYVNATMTTTGGTVYPYTFNSTATGANDFSFFLTTEKGHLTDINVTYCDNIIALNTDKTLSTYCNATTALDFTDNTDVEAYTAKYNSETNMVKLTKVTTVPAGAGVILKNLNAVSTAFVKVAASAEALSDNELVAATEATTLNYSSDSKYNYVLSDGSFCPVDDNTTLAAGKAYLATGFDVTTVGAKAINITFDDATAATVVDAEAAAPATKKYFQNGQILIQTAKGTFNAAGQRVE